MLIWWKMRLQILSLIYYATTTHYLIYILLQTRLHFMWCWKKDLPVSASSSITWNAKSQSLHNPQSPCHPRVSNAPLWNQDLQYILERKCECSYHQLIECLFYYSTVAYGKLQWKTAHKFKNPVMQHVHTLVPGIFGYQAWKHICTSSHKYVFWLKFQTNNKKKLENEPQKSNNCLLEKNHIWTTVSLIIE